MYITAFSKNVLQPTMLKSIWNLTIKAKTTRNNWWPWNQTHVTISKRPQRCYWNWEFVFVDRENYGVVRWHFWEKQFAKWIHWNVHVVVCVYLRMPLGLASMLSANSNKRKCTPTWNFVYLPVTSQQKLKRKRRMGTARAPLVSEAAVFIYALKAALLLPWFLAPIWNETMLLEEQRKSKYFNIQMRAFGACANR